MAGAHSNTPHHNPPNNKTDNPQNLKSHLRVFSRFTAPPRANRTINDELVGLAALVVLLGLPVELIGGRAQVLGLLHQPVQVLATSQDVVHGLDHHTLNFFEVALDLRDLVGLRGVLEPEE